VEEIEHILRNFGLILGAGLVSQLIATVIKIPQMVVLVAAGALIGPSVLGLVSNPLNGVGAQLLFNVGVALILFHGGTGISLQVISRTAVGLGLLVLPGVLLTAIIVALAYFSTESLGGSAYLATFVMGLMVGNMEMLGLGHHDEHATLLEGFLGQVAEIATLLVFVTLGLNLPFEALGQYFFGGLVVMFVFIFVARPITVLACLLPDRRGGWTGKEIAFISWCRETGVIPAAVASLLLARGVEGAEIAVSMVALAVCVTLLLQATTAGYVARRLNLVEL
jgi:cell volume regulation protein A